MNRCYDEGVLRAYLDDELSPEAQESMTVHIAACPHCQALLTRLRDQTLQVRAVLTDTVPPSDFDTALQRLHQGVDASATPSAMRTPVHRQQPSFLIMWRNLIMQRISRFLSERTRPVIATATAIVVLVALLLLPPVRTAADQLLQIFRVQQVLFMPISAERMEQLENLDFDTETLLIGEPETIEEPADPVVVESFADAANMIDCSLQQPTTFPTTPITTEFTVRDSGVVQFQVNAEASQQLLELMDIHDVTIPDTLDDEPIVVEFPMSLMADYQGETYTLGLYQACSPQITLPDGVDLSQLGKAALRLLGMESQQAETLSQQIDWSSTLLFPFPADLDSIRQVTINGTEGLLTRGGTRHEPSSDADEDEQYDHHTYESFWQLYWQDNGTFYVLVADGNVDQADIIATAESLD